jgi:hypothetical protein
MSQDFGTPVNTYEPQAPLTPQPPKKSNRTIIIVVVVLVVLCCCCMTIGGYMAWIYGDTLLQQFYGALTPLLI